MRQIKLALAFLLLLTAVAGSMLLPAGMFLDAGSAHLQRLTFTHMGWLALLLLALGWIDRLSRPAASPGQTGAH